MREHARELQELKELCARALELVKRDPRRVKVPKKVKIPIYSVQDTPHTPWYSVAVFDSGSPHKPHVIMEQEITVYEDVENPNRQEVEAWLEEARPVAERLAQLLPLFPIKVREEGYMRYVASDGTIEDYDWLEVKRGPFFEALGISIPDLEKVRWFVKSVLGERAQLPPLWDKGE
jgi:hypothetical protein